MSGRTVLRAKRIGFALAAVVVLAGSVANGIMTFENPVWLLGVVVCSYTLARLGLLAWDMWKDGEL